MNIVSEIARRAAAAEILNARMLGAGWFEAYGSGYRALDEIREVIAFADPTFVLPRFRTYGPR